MKILILEDDARRRAAMSQCLAERFPHYEVLFAATADGITALIGQHFDDTILIALDHDLDLVAFPDDRLQDSGTGRDVADWLAERSPVCPIVIHSTNFPAAIAMQSVLQDAGWEAHRVSPFADLEWVSKVWLRTVRDAIVGFAYHPISPPSE